MDGIIADPTRIQAFEIYISSGYSLVPIPAGQKGPNIPRWQSLRITSADEIPDGSNVGIILGTASSGLVCVDLDHAKAVELASEFLPETGMIGGRGSVSSLHWFYRTTDVMKKRAFSSSCKQKFIEILADGQQVVVGPSVHPDGTQYSVVSGLPALIDQEELIESVQRLFNACLVETGLSVASGVPLPAVIQPAANGHVTQDLYTVLVQHGAGIYGEGTTAQGNAGFYVRCPGEAFHTSKNNTKDCMVWTGTGGGWQARCQHTSCGVDSWAAYKSQLDPSWFPAAAAAVSVSPTPIVSDAWGDPVLLPNTLNSVDPFELELLPNAFRDRVEDISVRMSCPPDFSGMAIVVCAASVIGRRVAIRPKEFDDWTVVPNLWGCGVGRPGLMKTSALQQVMHPLKLLATEAHEKYTKEMKEFLANNELALLKHKQAKKEVAVSLVAGDVDDDALKKQLASAVEEDPPVHRRYIVMDSTYEAVCDMLRESQHGFLQYRDELSGWWATLAKEGQENARSFWLECWNGDGDYYIDRIGRGRIHIPINTISVLGATQPGKIQAYLQGAIKGDTGDDGMIQRHQMLVWPDSSAEWKQYDKWPNADAKRETLAAFRRLDTMTAGEIGATQDAGDDLPYLRFTSEAQRVFDEWLGQLEHQLRSDEDPPYLESHFSKYRSLIPSLALVFHLVDVGEGRIGFDSITRAIRWGTYLASHARRAYGVLDLVTVSAARKILKRIETGELKDGFSIRDIYLSHQTGLATKLDAEAAVELLVDYGWLRTRKVASGGRPSTVCDLHPKIHEYPLRSGTKSIKSPPNTTLGTFGTSSEGVNGNFNHDTETLNEEAAECF